MFLSVRSVHALGERSGPGDVVALREVDAELAQQLERLGVLDALGDGLQAEAARERDDRLDDVGAGRVRREVAHELDVDLEEVERELLEVGEAAVAGAEVVEGELAAERVRRSAKRRAATRPGSARSR